MKTTPAYNLSVVVRETGIKPDTLRAWERRYGLPHPSRTEGGHRLYSEKDIETIKWLIARQNEGVRIKQAVDLWNQMTASGTNPLAANPAGKDTQMVEPQVLVSGQSIEKLRSDWVSACRNFDETTADQIVNYAFALYPLETVCFDVLLAGLAEIGEAWYLGEATVQQEHFASALVTRRLDALLAAMPTPTREGNILVACPPGEDHTISSLMLTLLLRQRGWRVVYLGANVPKEQLDGTINSIQPLLLILSAQHIESAASLLDLAEHFSQRGTRIAFGGLIFNRHPQMYRKFPGYYLGNKIRGAVSVIEEIILSTPPIPSPVSIPAPYQATLGMFLDQKTKIETKVRNQLDDQNLLVPQLSLVNQYMSQHIQAALRLGDLDYLELEFAWLTNLFENHQVNPAILKTYLQTYLHAAIDLMDESGLLANWLSQNYQKFIS